MTTRVLLVDDNARRSADRQGFLAAAGVEIIAASDAHQAVEVIKSLHIDIICIDSEFVAHHGPWLGAFIKRQGSWAPVVLIVDDDRIPAHFEKHVDIVIDRADFAITGRGLIRELMRGHIPFFKTWFEDWMNRAARSGRSQSIRTY